MSVPRFLFLVINELLSIIEKDNQVVSRCLLYSKEFLAFQGLKTQSDLALSNWEEVIKRGIYVFLF